MLLKGLCDIHFHEIHIFWNVVLCQLVNGYVWEDLAPPKPRWPCTRWWCILSLKKSSSTPFWEAVVSEWFCFLLHWNVEENRCSLINKVFGIFSMCVLGKRLLRDISISDCNKNISGPLHQIFCGNSTNCDPYYEANDVFIVRGIKGLSSGVFLGECTFAKLRVMIRWRL